MSGFDFSSLLSCEYFSAALLNSVFAFVQSALNQAAWCLPFSIFCYNCYHTHHVVFSSFLVYVYKTGKRLIPNITCIRLFDAYSKFVLLYLYL